MNTNEAIGERVKHIREHEKGMSVAAFARLLDEKDHRIRDIESGKQKIPPEIITKLRNILNINPDWLLTGEGEMYRTNNRLEKAKELLNNIENNHKADVVNIPFYEDIYASAGAGAYNHNIKAELIPFSVTFLEKFLNIKNFNGIHIITAVGDSMTPTIEDNDKLFVLPIENENNIIKDGGVYVVSTPFGVLVKRIYLYPTKQEMILKSDNPNVKEEVIKGDMLKECKIIGRIVGILKGRV